MSKRPFATALIFSLTITILLRAVWDETTVYSLTENYTVPTRTPIPATKKPSSGGGSGSSNPEATDTPIPAAATNTAVPVTLAATPIGGFVPTAEACGEQPTIQAINTTRVRFGPGIDYEVVGKLVYLEVRPIIGRVADINWWQIMLADNTIGWVSDEIVIVTGNISVLPIVAAPAFDGSTPTSAPPWNPTLEPGCDALPVWTSTPEPTVPPTPVPPTHTSMPPTEEPEEAVVEELPTETAVPTTAPPQPTKIPTPIPTAAPLNIQTQTTNTGFLPIAAAVLLAAGGLFAFLRRNRG